MSQKNETTILWLSLIITLALVVSGLWWLKNSGKDWGIWQET
jgi:heme/copper-type cytochrome/quinol oxidase subunit 4